MPHMTIEYSANLASRIDMQAATDVALEALLETGLFEVGALRVRGVKCEAFAIADRAPENAFADVSLRIGAGRTAEEKRRAGEHVYGALKRHFAPLFETPHFALSFEIREIDPALSWKSNTMHSRLRGN